MSTFRYEQGSGLGVPTYLRMDRRETGDGDTEIGMVGTVPLGDHLRGPTGAMRTGGLVTLLDSVGGLCGGLGSLPRWSVTANVLTRVHRLDHRGPLRAEARVLRRGRTTVVSETTLVDEGRDDALVADGVLTSAVIEPADGPPAFERPVHIPPGPAPDDPPPGLDEFFGLRPVDDERGPAVELDLAPHLGNPWGIPHGGTVAVLVDAAAERAVTVGTGGPAATTDLALHFLSPGRVGPLRARGRVLGRRGDGHLVRVTAHDTGRGDALVALAAATVRPA